MARRTILLMLALLPWWGLARGQACCNAGSIGTCGSSTGLLTGYKSNTAGSRAWAVPFRTTSPGEEGYRDQFYLLELYLRYELSPRFRVMLQQPYRWNVRQFNGRTQTLDGLGDSRISATYAILDNCPCGKNAKLYWELGTGVKLPSGKYDQSIYYRDLPGNFNIGTGNFGYLLLSNLVFTRKNAGISLAGTYQINGESRDDYQYGNLFTTTLLFFREWAFGEKWALVPFAGLSFDKAGKNYLPSGNFAEGSGGEGWFAPVGLNARFEDWQLAVTTFKPFHQNYAGRAIAAKQRYSLELTWFF